MSIDDYEVGYKKPPGSTKYKKGTSGNPRGRPKKKPFDIDYFLQSFLNGQIVVREGDDTIKVVRAEAFVKKTFAQAMSGHAPSQKRLEKWIEQSFKKEPTRKYGVLVVPGKMTPEEWVEKARKTRDKMLETDGNEKA